MAFGPHRDGPAFLTGGPLARWLADLIGLVCLFMVWAVRNVRSSPRLEISSSWPNKCRFFSYWAIVTAALLCVSSCACPCFIIVFCPCCYHPMDIQNMGILPNCDHLVFSGLLNTIELAWGQRICFPLHRELWPCEINLTGSATS